jgi:hypothetical protein
MFGQTFENIDDILYKDSLQQLPQEMQALDAETNEILMTIKELL